MKSPVPYPKKRGCDPLGCGHFGAPRGDKDHKGLDLKTTPEQDVFSPIKGKFSKYGICYNDTSKFRYIEITGDKYRVRLLYVKKMPWSEIGHIVNQGDFIGRAQDISSYHSTTGKKMINHLHIEIYDQKTAKLLNPEKLLKL